MARRKDEKTAVNEVIIERALEDVMVTSMMPYAEHAILERALPRVEDGLKPVQRRILYAMMEMGITPDKPHKKSARIVGDTMGKYHPHGDSSIYDAMVRMAQDFNMGETLVDGHGNFGSIDGDSAAAMRYTEARLTPLSLELLRDIDKDTVPFSLNYDDTVKEPDMLPGRFPNLLVNGSKGIAVGLATDIPPHNLSEVIDATIALIDNPKLDAEGLMEYVKGPDFPTGGSIVGREGILQAYTTGKGRIMMRAHAELEPSTGGRTSIVITEIPYQVNKAKLLEDIQTLRESKKGILAGISEVRDETDREGMRAVIEVKRDADAAKILEYLYQHSNLQCAFNCNMVAIAHGKPALLNLKQILSYYIDYQKEVVTKRTRFDLEKAEAREHILLGLKIAIENIDEVVRIIKSSANPNEAKRGLMNAFNLTGIQAQAILDMRLQRLTSLETEKIVEELKEVQALIQKLKGILKSKAKLMQVIKDELTAIRKKYGHKRRTKIIDAAKIKEFKAEDYVIVEDTVVVCTSEGFIKRMNPNAFNRSNHSVAPDSLSDRDHIAFMLTGTTAQHARIFTSKGYIYELGVDELPEQPWKNKGVHLSSLLSGYDNDEKAVHIFLYDKVPEKGDYFFVTRSGAIKRTEAAEFAQMKRRLVACGLKEEDEVLFVGHSTAETKMYMVSSAGNAICFSTKEVSVMGRAAKGVKAMSIENDETILSAGFNTEEGELLIITEKGYGKRVLLVDIETQGRAGKGVKLINFNKNGSNGIRLVGCLAVRTPYDVKIKQKSGEVTVLNSEFFPIAYRSNAGSPIVLAVMGDDITGIEEVPL